MVITPYFFDIFKELLHSFQSMIMDSETMDSVDTDETVTANILNENQ